MKELEDIEKIALIINWYQGLPSDYRDGAELIHRRKQMAAFLFRFAQTVGDLIEDRNSAEYIRRSKFDRIKAKNIEAGDTAAMAETKAKAEIAEELKAELTADAAYQKANLLRIHALSVLDSMNQHISALNREKYLEMTGGGSQT